MGFCHGRFGVLHSVCTTQGNLVNVQTKNYPILFITFVVDDASKTVRSFLLSRCGTADCFMVFFPCVMIFAVSFLVGAKSDFSPHTAAVISIKV